MFLRYLALFIAGACLGALVNLGIYRLAYFRRRISPWGRTGKLAINRTWFDRLPIVGWWALRREERVHGRSFWVRPMLLELGFAIGIVALFWWELQRFAINTWLPMPNFHPRGDAAIATIHWQFAIHGLLLTLMAIATFIDIDEQTVPDAITVPGTLAALLIAMVCQLPALPGLFVNPQAPHVEDLVNPIAFDYPGHATEFLSSAGSMLVALACFLLWCFALLPRRWRLGVGIGKAFRVLCRRIIARPEWRWVLPIAVAGSAAIVVTWMRGGEHWRNMLSVLVGLATGGGMIWMIRLMGGAVLQREAMGFGDVTLMAMIGAFIGWQAVLVVFFLAAIFGLIAGLLQWLIKGDNVIPYGPFLCLGALVMVAFWSPIWEYFSPFFEFQWLVPTVILLCLPPLPFLLYALKWVRERFSASS